VNGDRDIKPENLSRLELRAYLDARLSRFGTVSPSSISLHTYATHVRTEASAEEVGACLLLGALAGDVIEVTEAKPGVLFVVIRTAEGHRLWTNAGQPAAAEVGGPRPLGVAA